MSAPEQRRPVSIFSLTPAGGRIGDRLACAWPRARHEHRPRPFADRVRAAFCDQRDCVLICSTGIAIRTLAPVLTDKHTDPGVVVIDDLGRFVIPLLSVHEGGAGVLADEAAELLDAQCVVTSASDFGDPVITVGIGCERGCPAENLRAITDRVLDGVIQGGSLAALASIDIKADETGLLDLAAQLDVPVRFFSASALREFEHLVTDRSEIVYREVGCYGVAESAALCAARELCHAEPELVVSKHKGERATAAVARGYRRLAAPEPVGSR